MSGDFYLGDGMYEGYIKLWRKTKDWAFFRRPLALALWVILLFEANHKPTQRCFNGKIVELKPGQLLTGRRYLSEKVGVSENTIEKYLKWFEKEQQIAQQTSTRNRLITILNWDIYQENGEQKRQQTAHRPAQQKDTPKNDKNIYNIYSKPEGFSGDFLTTIKTNPAYKDIDIDRELAKMDAWLLTRPGRKKTSRFVVNWLNKIDKPVAASPSKAARQEERPDANCPLCDGSGYVKRGRTKDETKEGKACICVK